MQMTGDRGTQHWKLRYTALRLSDNYVYSLDCSVLPEHNSLHAVDTADFSALACQ